MKLDNGVATIWRAEQAAVDGSKPKPRYSIEFFKSYYGSKTVGITRYWTAKAYDRRAEQLIQIQRNGGISTADICQVESYTDPSMNGYYKILQVQHVTDDDGLPMTDLTLERTVPIDKP